MLPAQPSPSPATHTGTRDGRLLGVKLALAVILVLLLVARDRDHSWPFITWPMFDTTGEKAPGRGTTTIHMRVVDAQGNVHIVWESELFTTVPPTDARLLIEWTFTDDDPETRQRAALQLIPCVQMALPGVDIVEIQGWRVSWRMDPYASPPFDPLQPTEENLLGSFRVADVLAQAGAA